MRQPMATKHKPKLPPSKAWVRPAKGRSELKETDVSASESASSLASLAALLNGCGCVLGAAGRPAHRACVLRRGSARADAARRAGGWVRTRDAARGAAGGA